MVPGLYFPFYTYQESDCLHFVRLLSKQLAKNVKTCIRSGTLIWATVFIVCFQAQKRPTVLICYIPFSSYPNFFPDNFGKCYGVCLVHQIPALFNSIMAAPYLVLPPTLISHMMLWKVEHILLLLLLLLCKPKNTVPRISSTLRSIISI